MFFIDLDIQISTYIDEKSHFTDEPFDIVWPVCGVPLYRIVFHIQIGLSSGDHELVESVFCRWAGNIG